MLTKIIAVIVVILLIGGLARLGSKIPPNDASGDS
jgi:hypothetical protein